MITGCIAFFFGIISLLFLPSLPSGWQVFLLLAVIVLACIRFRCWCLIWLVAGFTWGLIRADMILSHELPHEIHNTIINIKGQITGIPQIREASLRFDFLISRMEHQGLNIDSGIKKVRLSWYGQFPELHPDEIWELTVKLKRPHGFRNPAGFDYEAYLFRNKIRATGYVLNQENKNFRTDTPHGKSMDYYRYKIGRYIETRFHESPHMPLLLALIIGERSKMDNRQWRILTESGTSHLLAISGLHVGMVAGFVFFIIRWLWSFTGIHFVPVPAQRVASYSAIIIALIYAGLAGFSIPTQRAMIMLSIVLLTVNLPTPVSHIKVFFFTLFLVLLHDPFCVISAGFWLSFSAIGLLIYGFKYRVSSTNKKRQWIKGQFLLITGLMPVLFYWFQQAPAVSSLANFFCVPWIGVITLPLVFTGTLLIPVNEMASSFVMIMGIKSLEIMWHFLEFISIASPGMLQAPRPDVITLILAIVGILTIYLPTGIPARWAGLYLLIPLLFPVSYKLDEQSFKMIMFEVGQGLAVLIETPDHLVLYDTGPAFSSTFDAGEDILIPYFRYRGFSKLDLLIQSHADLDHIGGLGSLMESINIANIFTSTPDKIPDNKGRKCRKYQKWSYDGIIFEILHPQNDKYFTGNNASCVMKISNQKYSVLLTGDIEKSAEQYLVNHEAGNLKSDFLIAPHHGSNTSSSPSFIEAVDPDFVLFPVGHSNRFGFPKDDIVDRYRQRGIRMLNVAQTGAIEIIFDNIGYKIHRYGIDNRRFWFTDDKNI